MMKRFFGFLIGFFCLSALSAEVEFSGDVETSWGLGAPWVKEEQAGAFTLGQTSFTGQLDAYFGNSSAYAEAGLSYDALTGELDLSLGELWLDYTDAVWGIRLGRQKAAWGKADGIDITNVLCPSDMSSLAAMTSDDSKLAVDALRLSLTGNQFTADAWWIPFFTPSKLPLEEGNPLRALLVPASIDLPLPAMNTVLTLPVKTGQLENPQKKLWNGEYGLKLSGYFSVLDFSLYGFYGWDDIPLLNYTIEKEREMPSAMVISGQYERMSMLGADAALPLGETVLRLEAAFFPQRHFQKSAQVILSGSEENSQKHNQLAALAGIDWMPSGWTITAQYYCDYVFADMKELERKEAYTHGASVSLSKSLLNETLEINFAALLGLNDFDSMINPSIQYSLSDQINLACGAYIFLEGPDAPGQYGAYKDLSSLYIDAKFSF